jgi:hypothetical protein
MEEADRGTNRSAKGSGRDRTRFAQLFSVGENYVQQARALVERDPDASRARLDIRGGRPTVSRSGSRDGCRSSSSLAPGPAPKQLRDAHGVVEEQTDADLDRDALPRPLLRPHSETALSPPRLGARSVGGAIPGTRPDTSAVTRSNGRRRRRL